MSETSPPSKMAEQGFEVLPMSRPSKPLLKAVPNPEVRDRPRRRTFSAAYKLAILRELDAAAAPGDAGALLRREGLYSSHITDWRRLRELGELQSLTPKKRGRPKKQANPLVPRIAELERDLARAREALRKAHIIIEVQKKVSEMLGDGLAPDDGRND